MTHRCPECSAHYGHAEVHVCPMGTRIARPKPRLVLMHTWSDCGFEYEWWACITPDRKGFGPSPKKAYDDWRRFQ